MSIFLYTFYAGCTGYYTQKANKKNNNYFQFIIYYNNTFSNIRETVYKKRKHPISDACVSLLYC